MTEQYGYAGNILRVDLSSGAITRTPTANYSDRFLGGRGIAARIYWDEGAPDTGALDPENRLLFMTGPLACFPVVGGSRWTVCGKSPATAPEQFSYSNLGGYWGAQLKFAGYDGLVVYGKSERPVYLFIDNDAVEIRDASALRGKTSVEAREALKREIGSTVRVVACGPAGENLIPFASLLADSDASGSGGFGAVMGSKNLKAIAVRGRGKMTAAQPERFIELCRYVREINRGYEARYGRLSYKRGIAKYASKMKRDLCYGCIGACIRATYEADDGTRGKFMCGASLFYEGRARGYYGEVNDVPFFATKLCDYYGLDTEIIFSISTWLSRCHKAGILNDENTGIPLSKRGSLEFIETLVKKIAFREGFGEVLAQGVSAAAGLVGKGAEEFTADYTVKGGFGSIYCPRMYPVSGLLYAVEPRRPIQQLHEIGTVLFEWVDGMRKIEGSFLTTEAFLKIAERFWGSEAAADFSTSEGKALAAAIIQDRQYAKESLVLCDFMWPVTSAKYSEDHVGDPTIESRLFSAITGRETSEQELYRTGERIFNLQRAILAREGHHGRECDTLPEVYYTVPLRAAAENHDCLAPGKGGEIISKKGAVVDRDEFERMKGEYYALRGWDVNTGLQTKEKLRELGLEDIAEGLG